MIAPVQRLSTTLLLDGRAAALPVLLATTVYWYWMAPRLRWFAGSALDTCAARAVQCSRAFPFPWRFAEHHCMQSPLVRKNKGPGPPKCQTATFCYMDSQKEAALHELNPKNNVPLSCQASGPGVPWCDNIYHTCINTSGAKRVLEYHHLIIQHSVSVAISKVWLLHIDLISQLIEADFVRCPSLKMSINRDRYSKDPLLELN